MKNSLSFHFCLVMLVAYLFLFASAESAFAQGDAGTEAKFIAMLKNATLKGTWAPVQQGKLGSEKGGDSYRIARVEKGEGDKWSIVTVFMVGDKKFGVSDFRIREVRWGHRRSYFGQCPRRTRESQLVGACHVP